MTVIPEMPDDWWPDAVVVHAHSDTRDGRRLGNEFVLTPEDIEYPERLARTMDALRLVIWTAKHAEPAE